MKAREVIVASLLKRQQSLSTNLIEDAEEYNDIEDAIEIMENAWRPDR